MGRTRVVVAVLIAVASVIAIAWLRCTGSSQEHASVKDKKAGSARAKRAGGAKTEMATVSGRVTRKVDGSGIAGAVVSLTRIDGTLPESHDEQRSTTVAVSSETGAWSVQLAPGRYAIAASAVGFVPATRGRLVIDSSAARAGMDLALEAGGTTLRGTITDTGGGPIEGARVSASHQATNTRHVALSGADGRYQLTLAAGFTPVRVTHPDYVGSGIRYLRIVEAAAMTMDLSLEPAGVVRGRVLARDTKHPVANIEIRAMSDGTTGAPPSFAGAVSDNDGRFELRGLSAATIQIEARGRGYATPSHAKVPLALGQQVEDVEVLLDRAYTIAGRVIRKDTKKGVEGAMVQAMSPDHGDTMPSFLSSDAEGRFEIIGLLPGRYTVSAHSKQVLTDMPMTVDVADRDVEVMFELDVGTTLSGRIEPPGVADVALEIEEDYLQRHGMLEVNVVGVHGKSDASGAFTLHNVPVGTFDVAAMRDDGHAGKTRVTVSDAGLTGVVVRLAPRAAISGKVVENDGTPVAGTQVSALAFDGRPYRSATRLRPRGGVTAADGTFRLVGVEGGTHLVIANAEHRSGSRATARIEVHLVEGVEMSGVVIAFESRNGVIQGVVVGPDRKPVRHASVKARAAERSGESRVDIRPVRVAADGTFTISGLPRGTFTLVAEAGQALHGETRGVKPGEHVTIELGTPASLAITVTSHDQPVTAYHLLCSNPGGLVRVDREVSASDGTYRIDELPPGLYKCRVDAASGGVQTEVKLSSAGATLALELEPWVSVTGMVVSLIDGRPLPDLLVTAGNVSRLDSENVVSTDASGRFVIARVRPGKGELQFSPREVLMRPYSHDYVAQPDSRTDIGTIKVLPPRAGEAGRLGLVAEPDGSALKVIGVEHGRPAHVAGVLVGDRIVSIAGRRVADLGVDTASKALTPAHVGVGQLVHLGLEREGKMVALMAVPW